MKNKIIGIFVCMLLIVTNVLSVADAVDIMINKEIKQIEDIQNQEFVPGEFIVKFTKNTEISNPSTDINNEKYQVNYIEKLFRNSENTILDNIYRLRVTEEVDILSIVKDYASLPDVVYAEPNYILRPFIIPRNTQQSVPRFINDMSSSVNTNDPDFSKQWALDNTGQVGGIPDSDIDALEVWNIEKGDPDVVIAIVDTGIDYNHPDLADNIWINEDEIPDNGIDDDGNGFVDDVRGWDFAYDDNDPLDDHGHGTHCAGIAAARSNNSIGIAGVCWNCKIMSVKTHYNFGFGYISDIAMGIIYAVDNSADVISMSFGSNKAPNLLKDVVDYAYSKDIVLVAAAGNNGVSDEFYPAAFNNVIAVAGTDNNDERMNTWDFIIKTVSNYGPWVDVAAPGEEIYSTMPTYHVFLNIWGWKKNYDYLSGTSMATPHVAGLAALLLSKYPSLSLRKVKSLICENVDRYYSKYYLGTGRINAFKALNENILPPEVPETPTGLTHGKKGEKYTYTTKTTDPQGDQVYYMWDWGDEVSIWIGPFDSGETISEDHIWIKKGNYYIKVKAKNIGGAESDWSDLFAINMPKNKVFIFNFPLLNWFFERFPNAFPLLRYLAGL